MSKTKIFLIPFIILLQTGFLTVHAQSKKDEAPIVITDTTDLDALFRKARELSYANNNEQARKICQKILEKNPNYYDVRTFIGRTYAWDHMYDNARTELSRVLIEREDDIEALSALIDVESWSGNEAVANDYLKIALHYYPTSESLLLQKVKMLLQEEEKETASITLRKILDLNPGNKEALNMLNGLSNKGLDNKFQILYTTDFYDKTLQPQKLVSAELGRSFNFGSAAIRGSFADKRYPNSHISGMQYEGDVYAHILKTNYIYVNAGFGEDPAFPKFRAAFESYQKLKAGFELSAGVRYLLYSNPATTIYTASLGNYFRNYYFLLRTYITPKSVDGTSDILKKTAQTYILSVRNYFGDADNFIEFRAGRGQSPDERKLATAITPRLNTYQGAVEYQLNAFGRWILKGTLEYAREEIRADTFQQRITLGITMKTIF